METFSSIWISIQNTALTSLPAFLDYLPSLISALAVLIFGWILARFVRAASQRILSGLNRVLERTFQTGLLASARLPMGASTVFGELAFWVIVFITLTISARVAQLPTISHWLNQIVLFLPEVLFGVAAIVVGYLISIVVGEQVTDAARTAKSSYSEFLGRIAQGAVFIIASIIGLDQIGVDITFLVTMSGVAVGAILLGFSIAFGLGSKEYVSNLISARTVLQSLSPGLLVRIGETEGEVLEITQTHIAVDTENGRALIPARIAEISGVVIVSHHAASVGESS